ncbi:ATP-binding cassette domain-containing protein [Spiroplasma cantharicola]|uniref:ABC transporter domain-containing protein n=1 Tax=Spiroplasma cantharicola TaxID=362837 RepID=A0A0M3SJD5_9MOLU|nr:ATP-binding cassette domain-containing protein [Spiroplasma cantharicola]ALD66544.1 hypothetical protein SCANT_v1c06380 [Spiroplasma cantharicola]
MIQIKNFKLEKKDQFLFEIEKLLIDNNNQVIGLIGNNGSGKTSFAKAILGIENDYKGLLINKFKTLYIEQNYFLNEIFSSGGEYTKDQIIKAFNLEADLLILLKK